jgi:hypothetical protein
MAQEKFDGATDVIKESINLEDQPASAQEIEKQDAWINDEQFISDLKRLKDLRSFFIQGAVNLNVSDLRALSFGRLNLLRFQQSGRAPTEDEWGEVEYRTQVLFSLLTEPLRRRFILGEIPFWMAWLPIILAGIGLASLMGAVHTAGVMFQAERALVGVYVLPFYLAWLMSLGAIGSVAFIGMNALSVQQDITFDLTNTRLMVLRIALGALFGLVLTLPFGFDGFVRFCVSIVIPSDRLLRESGVSVTTETMLLLLPFILGFSTSLVIMILNQLVEAVQAFFGRRGSGSDRQPLPIPEASAGQGSVQVSRRNSPPVETKS